MSGRRNNKAKNVSVKKQTDKNTKAIKMLKMRPEMKVKTDITTLGTLISGTTQILLNGMEKGDDWGDRIGQEIRNQFLSVNVHLENIAALNHGVRVMLINVKEPKGSLFQASQLFSFVVTSLEVINSVKNYTFDEHYKVYYDRIHYMSNAPTASTGDPPRDKWNAMTIKIRQKLFGLKTIFNGTNSTLISGIERNALYLVLVAETATTINNQSNWALHYLDS